MDDPVPLSEQQWAHICVILHSQKTTSSAKRWLDGCRVYKAVLAQGWGRGNSCFALALRSPCHQEICKLTAGAKLEVGVAWEYNCIGAAEAIRIFAGVAPRGVEVPALLGATVKPRLPYW